MQFLIRSENLSAKKIIVTGGSGNLGRWTVRALSEAGHDVLSLDRAEPPERLCETRVADLSDIEALQDAFRGADAVVHLAAWQSPDEAPHDEVFRNNVSATYNVLKAAADAGVRRVVHASSVAAYGFLYAPKMWPPDYLPLDEDHPCRPRDPYALSKIFGEQLADSFVSTGGASVVSLRLSGVNFDLTYESLPERWKDPGRKMGTFWSYVDVRDAAESCRLAVEADLGGHEIFNIAAETSRYPEPTSELVERYLPGVKIKDGFEGRWGGLDVARARDRLGFEARHVWEDYLENWRTREDSNL